MQTTTDMRVLDTSKYTALGGYQRERCERMRVSEEITRVKYNSK